VVKALVDRSVLRVEPLNRNHLTRFGTFLCGVPDLDAFLKDDAYRLHEAHISFTYLGFLEIEGEDEEEFVGYISLITDALTLEPEEKTGLPEIQFSILPALKVARLASTTTAKARFKGIGSTLMGAAWIKGVELAQTVATRFLTVDALESAVSFYEKLGFVRNTAKTYTKKKQHVSMRLDIFAPELPSWVL
jgi:GNAT superfamily N-acetyltransferase